MATSFIPFNERPEWADIKPIPQDDGPNPVVPIAYAPECMVIFYIFTLKKDTSKLFTHLLPFFYLFFLLL